VLGVRVLRETLAPLTATNRLGSSEVHEYDGNFSPIIIGHRLIRETRDILWAGRCLQPAGVRSDADQVDRTQIAKFHG